MLNMLHKKLQHVQVQQRYQSLKTTVSNSIIPEVSGTLLQPLQYGRHGE